MTKDKPRVHRVVLGAAIFEKDRLFLLKRRATEPVFPGKWEIPGGMREFFETCEQGIFREVMEEAGFPIRLIDMLSTFDYVIDADDRTLDSTQINFLAEPAASRPSVRLSQEHQDFAWVTESELGAYEMSEAMKSVVLHAFNKSRVYRMKGLWAEYSAVL
jgi:8-oxo-dGTP diphosphatase